MNRTELVMTRQAMDFRDKVEKAFDDAKPSKSKTGMVWWTARELCAVKVPEPQTGDRWGDWVLDLHDLVLFYQQPSSSWWTEVDLERESIELWLKHFAGKCVDLRGGNAKSLGDLADALIELARRGIFTGKTAIWRDKTPNFRLRVIGEAANGR